MKPLRLNPIWRIFDMLMWPIMVLISGALREKPQETHIWHVQEIDHSLAGRINTEIVASTQGGDSSPYTKGMGVLFHIPIFGGWKEYTVLELKGGVSAPWYLGWLVRSQSTGVILKFDIHKLPIAENRVRILPGTAEHNAQFFAVNDAGEQFPLKVIATGRIGDGKYGDVRLF